MSVYTKTGDQGITGLLTGQRIAKDSARVEAYGCIDEADAHMGMARALSVKADVRDAIYKMQQMLSMLMADVASIGADKSYISAEHIHQCEQMIDKFDAMLSPLTQFVVPGDNQSSAALHIARTVVRRAERQMWRLARQEKINDSVLIVLNRLSDLCFVLARIESQA